MRLAFVVALLGLTLRAVAEEDPLIEKRPLSFWVERLHGIDSTLRRKACRVLVAASPRTEEIARALVLACRRSSDEGHTDVALAALQTTPDLAAPGLAEGLRGGRSSRLALLRGLHAHPRLASRVVTAILECLSDADYSERLSALSLLGRIGPEAAEGLPQILALADEPDLHQAPIDALMRIAPSDPRAIQAFEKGFTSADHEKVQYCAVALSKAGPAAIPVFLRGLSSTDYGTRCVAAEALGLFEAEADEVVPPLARALGDSTPGVRMAAMCSLMHLGPAARDAVPALVKELADRTPVAFSEVEVCPPLAALAAATLGAIGPAAHEAVPSLLRLLGSGVHLEVDDTAAAALSLIAPEHADVQRALLDLSQSAHPCLRPSYVHALGNLPVEDRFVEAIRIAVRDTDPALRTAAACALARMVRRGAKEGDELLGAFLGGDDGLRAEVLFCDSAGGEAHVWDILRDHGLPLKDMYHVAVTTLEGRGSYKTCEAVERLRCWPSFGTGWEFEDCWVHPTVRAIDLLAWLPRETEGVLDAARNAAKSGNPYVRRRAEEVLASMPSPAAVLPVRESLPDPALVEALRGTDQKLRNRAVEEIRAAGPPALETVLVALQATLETAHRRRSEDGFSDTESALADCIKAMGQGIVPRLRGELASDDVALRRRAAWALWMLCEEGEEAAEDLRRALDDVDPTVRAISAQALWLADPTSPDTSEALARRLTDPEGEVRRAAARALDYRASSLPEVPALLVPALDSSDRDVVWQAAGGLADSGENGRVALPRLFRMLEDPDARLRMLAANTIGRMGIPEPEAVTALTKRLEDPDSSVVLEAACALCNFRREGVAPLVGALSSPSSNLRRQAAWFLGVIGPEAASGVPDLERLLEDPDPEVQKAATEALRKIRGE